MWQYFWPHAVYDIIITLKEVKVQYIGIGSIRPGFVCPKSGSLMNIMHLYNNFLKKYGFGRLLLVFLLLLLLPV
jgi:hypothetical protein